MLYLAAIILVILGIYLVIGIVFYVLFLSKLASELDQNTKGASIGFKLLIFPGIISLWPVVFSKWKQVKKLNTKPKVDD